MNKILIIDDEPLIRDLLTMALEDDYIVQTCNDGLEAWNWLQNNAVDLILTDIVMPKMDGIDLISKIRLSSDIPIIAMSGGSGGRISHLDGRLALAKKSGANIVVEKPFELKKLMGEIENLIQNSPIPNLNNSTFSVN